MILQLFLRVKMDKLINVKPRNDLRMGQSIKLAFDMEKCHLFDVETEKCLTSK